MYERPPTRSRASRVPQLLGDGDLVERLAAFVQIEQHA